MNRFFRGFFTIAAVGAVLRIAFSANTVSAFGSFLRSVGQNPDFVSVMLGSENTETSSPEIGTGESALSSPEPSSAVNISSVSSAAPQSELSSSPTPDSSTQESSSQTSDTPQIEIKNSTSYTIDVAQLLAEPLSYTLDADEPQVLIIHTHGSEAYSQEGGTYVASAVSRTEDKSNSVIKVGDVLTDALTERGLNVLHDRDIYDYPSYSGSYSRSLAAVEGYLEKYPSIKVVIDLHRDSASDGSGGAYRTEYVAPGGTVCSQLMIIAATGASGLDFPNWKENMKLAVRLQTKIEEKYSGLARPLLISGERYNENAAPGYLLIEVGTDGNTIQEAENAASLFADCASDVLSEVIS